MKRDALHELDFNLLHSLAYLLDTAHVSRAAEKAGVAQPVMSRTLAKLRVLFDDPLLEPVGRRLELTSRALELKPRVEEFLAAARYVLEPARAFDPATATGVVKIAAAEYTT